MPDLKPHEQDKLRYLLNAFAAAPENVREEALRQLNMKQARPLRLIRGAVQ